MSKSVKIGSSKISTDYDIVISGGGVVGCLTALALAKETSFSILLLEAVNVGAKPLTSASHTKRFDARVIALSADSLSTLENLDVNIDDIAHQAIEQIHVSDRGHIGQVKLSAKEQGIAALGKVVAIEALGEHLLNKIKSLSGKIDYKCPLKIEKAKQSDSKVTLELSDSSKVCTKLLIVSDGGQSKTASLVGMQSELTSYGQTAIIANVNTQLAHKNIAYERFTSQGPIAFLPMNTSATNKASKQHSMSVVWCLNQQFAEQKLQLSEQAFLQELSSLFGHKLGRLTACSQRYSYPLSLSQSCPFVSYRSISVGNAAQSLHPIAGQGFNLGVRDVAALVKVVKDVTDPGEFACIQLYRKCRQADKDETVFATEALVKIFSNQYIPFVIARNLGLFALNSFSGPKHQFANFAMGMRKSHD